MKMERFLGWEISGKLYGGGISDCLDRSRAERIGRAHDQHT